MKGKVNTQLRIDKKVPAQHLLEFSICISDFFRNVHFQIPETLWFLFVLLRSVCLRKDLECSK